MSKTVIVTGAAGLIGSEATKFFSARAFDVVGIDNDMRRYFFGEEASTAAVAAELRERLPNLTFESCDIRDRPAIDRIFADRGSDIALIIHTAAQPSHDWAAREPITDFTINANGTLILLEAARRYCPHAVFIFTSTNKVYGDRPNGLPLVEYDTRWDVAEGHPYHARGIDESMSIDATLH